MIEVILAFLSFYGQLLIARSLSCRPISVTLMLCACIFSTWIIYVQSLNNLNEWRVLIKGFLFFSPFTDEQSRLFNANCRNDVLLQHIKKRCDCHREGKTKHPKIMSKPEVTQYPATLVLFNIDTDPLPTESQLHNLQFYICLNRWL